MQRPTRASSRFLPWRHGAARHFAALAAAALVVLAAVPPAAAQYAWSAIDNEAAATLPTPEGDADFVLGAKLACAEQKWTLSLDTAAGALLPASGDATLSIDGSDDVSSTYTTSPGAVVIPVPREAIQPLQQRLRLEIALSGIEGTARFSLRGSKSAIGAVQQMCTPRVVAGFNKVVLTPYSSYLNLARQLRADDIKAFASATSSQPEVTAAMLDLPQNRRLLFAQLCGSYWYFGESGCNVTGYAQEGDGDWTQVYDAEGMFLFVDPEKGKNGWPDITGIPLQDGYDELHWTWSDGRYAFEGPAEVVGQGD